MQKPEHRDGGGRPPSPFGFFGIGVELVVPILIGVFVGNWLDGRYDWTPWGLITGSMLGIVIGFVNFFKSILPRGGGDGKQS